MKVIILAGATGARVSGESHRMTEPAAGISGASIHWHDATAWAADGPA